MPNITFDKHTIERAKNKEGVYSTLRNPRPNARRKLSDTLCIPIEEFVKLAFYEWAGKHKGGSKIVDREWSRFQKVLQRYL